jgi:dolichol-phosphate mannosyltransferase
MTQFIKPKSLSVVVPVRNEEDNIVDLILEIRKSLKNKIDYEIIYVDDGSVDHTHKNLVTLQKKYKELLVIRHQKSYGQSTAIRTGVKHAKYDWIATLDGDGQNNPADILLLLNALKEGVELAGGNRRHSRRDTWIKRISSVIANAVRSWMLQDDAPDTGCGLKLFSKEAFLDLPYFDHMHRFLPALIKRRGGQIVSIPVSHRPRSYGQSNYGTIDRLLVGIVDLFGVAWLQRRSKLPQIKKD